MGEFKFKENGEGHKVLSPQWFHGVVMLAVLFLAVRIGIVTTMF